MISREFPNTFFNPKKFELSGLVAPIAFDMDSVLNEGGAHLRQAVADHFGYPVEDIIKTEKGYEEFHFTVPGVTDKEVYDAVNVVIGRDSIHYDTTPHMYNVLEWLFTRTYMPITIVTARHPDNMAVTFKWLKKNLRMVPFRLIMVNGMQKEVVLTRLDNKLFIDDRYKTIKTLENHIDFPVLYMQPWNQGRPQAAGVFEVDDLTGLPYVLQMIEEHYHVKL